MKLDSSLAAIVTGGASGLGEATARMLAGHGVSVAIFDMNRAKGEAVARDIGGIFAAVDVTDEESVEAGLATARQAHGVERILVNCAGIVHGRRTVTKDRDTGALKPHDIASFRKVVEVNLIGTFTMMAKCAVAMAGEPPLSEDGERGVIISTSSVAATDGQIGQAAYSASKGGVLAITLPVARDLMGHGIRVLTIQPGIFWTPMFDQIAPDYRASLAESVPFPKRLGTPREYADLVRFLCENGYINGESVRLDGAVRLAPK
ncbi:MAG TPA: SDR family NAD(P)-dependent oxidoreductase [Propylenella sp.]|nr:SDR family NAD(P)-dependent oxidoreductase [Propylenella sp.]